MRTHCKFYLSETHGTSAFLLPNSHRFGHRNQSGYLWVGTAFEPEKYVAGLIARHMVQDGETGSLGRSLFCPLCTPQNTVGRPVKQHRLPVNHDLRPFTNHGEPIAAVELSDTRRERSFQARVREGRHGRI